MSKIYRYILVSDDGMAPCVDAGIVTLATCKPVVRRCAVPGDWVLGFYPSPADPGTLAWAGRVATRLEHGDYQLEFSKRSDAVYRMQSNGTYEILRPSYHPDPDQRRRDYENGVLIFDESATWYFGESPVSLPQALMHLAMRGQGHRVNNRRDGDLIAMERWLHNVAPAGLHGQPRHAPSSGCMASGCAPFRGNRVRRRC